MVDGAKCHQKYDLIILLNMSFVEHFARKMSMVYGVLLIKVGVSSKTSYFGS